MGLYCTKTEIFACHHCVNEEDCTKGATLAVTFVIMRDLRHLPWHKAQIAEV